jgi:hypothetical protein
MKDWDQIAWAIVTGSGLTLLGVIVGTVLLLI